MTSAAGAPEAGERPIRVMIVDDSAVVRGMVARWMEETHDIGVTAMAVDGVDALKKLAEASVDVCILDDKMPNMSGLEALPRMLALKRNLRVIMAAALTAEGAELAIRALELGAADFIPKPAASRLGGAEIYRRDLLEKIRQLAPRARPAPSPHPPVAPLRAPAAPPQAQAAPFAPAALSRPAPATRAPSAAPITFTAPTAFAAHAPAAPSAPNLRHLRPEVLLVASSTGGPPALRQLFADLGGAWRTPVLIAQHMPAEFTKALARMIDLVTPFSVREAVSGETVTPGVVYIAPGNFHLTVRRAATGKIITHLDQAAQINWCRPSADPLFESASELWGASAVAVVLTGMGRDGRDGAAAVAAKGGRVIAQDEASSVVWGMPGAVVEAGIAERVLPLKDIAAYLTTLANGAY